MAICLNCGCEFTTQLKSNKHGLQKHVYCSNPECQQVGVERRRESQREASRKWRVKHAAGIETATYKQQETRATGWVCRDCGNEILKYKEHGVWIVLRLRCKKCHDKFYNHLDNLQAMGLGESIERYDGD